ncbi:Rpn family recombination-promoting nuclease/putative transposase [Bariatricus sp. HCP28S3_D3]|uniref:Rpn family recombination-promoting nuclease/putative transposase n=1 Tax=Bariatricus sp. HCP28S3_D3 TaxID=3438901 RepID=UPI003F88AB6F
MGQSNAAVRQWMGNPKRFADLFNATVFNGKQVIQPEELEPVDGEEDILLTDKNGKKQEVHRYRDIVMKWKKDAVLILLACENQAKVHYAMSVRNMLYDSLSYVGQIQRMWNKNVEKMTTAEFLSKFRKGDRLIPVLTLVFYYDVDQWDGSKDLYGMLQWSEDEKKNAVLKEYVPNYRINLIDAGNLEHLERFKSDLQEVLGMIQCRGDKESLLKYINDRKEYFQNVDEETYYVIREFLHSERMLKGNIEKSQGKETVDMCKALEDLYNEGIEIGMERGMTRGMECGMELGVVKGVVETLHDFGMEKDAAIQRVMQKFEISREKAEKDVESYWR